MELRGTKVVTDRNYVLSDSHSKATKGTFSYNLSQFALHSADSSISAPLFGFGHVEQEAACGFPLHEFHSDLLSVHEGSLTELSFQCARMHEVTQSF